MRSLADLAHILLTLPVGHRFMLQREFSDFRALWPNPQMPMKDDWLQPQQRAEQWCEALGCKITQYLDPPALVIERVSEKKDPPPMPKVDESIRQDMMEFYRGRRSRWSG